MQTNGRRFCDGQIRPEITRSCCTSIDDNYWQMHSFPTNFTDQYQNSGKTKGVVLGAGNTF